MVNQIGRIPNLGHFELWIASVHRAGALRFGLLRSGSVAQGLLLF